MCFKYDIDNTAKRKKRNDTKQPIPGAQHCLRFMEPLEVSYEEYMSESQTLTTACF